MKKIAIAVILAGVVLGNAHAQAAGQVYGRWMLTEHRTSGVGTYRPGDHMWTANYFIELNANGTFTEQNFWTPDFVATGTWALSGNTLILTLNHHDGGSFAFVGIRTLSLGAGGSVLTMDYRRPQWTYTAVFRQAQAPTQEQVLGRWNLTEHATTGMGEHRPGGPLWTTNYFIEFNANGTFTEQNFWTPDFVATGTWSLSGTTLTLTLNGPDRGSFEFVRARTLSVSADGRTLTMDYRRTYWAYTGTFGRAPLANLTLNR